MKRTLQILLMLIANVALGETPVLERSITVTIQQLKLTDALKVIADEGNFTFSYNSSILDGNRVVSYNFTNKTVREILNEIFKGTIEYKVRGKYIILTKSTKKNDEQVLSGYVVDETTGKKLARVSVYDPVSLSSAVTDNYGYFEIKVKKDISDLKLSVNKSNYTDTVVQVQKQNPFLNIPIKFDSRKAGAIADSVGQKIKRFWTTTISSFRNVNSDNIADTIYRKFQFALVPFIGTNGELSGNVVNDYSLNLIGGYALGSRKLEFGGVFNLEQGDVSGAQIAGVFNGVAGRSSGVQLAGVLNAVYDSSSAVRLAGVANINGGAVTSPSLAGVINLTLGNSHSLHVAGVGNVTHGQQLGPHIGGVFNISTNEGRGLQLAGVFNITAKQYKGTQLAGVFNLAGKDVHGVQLAGVMNLSGKTVTGSQISGVLNVARRVRGSQVGLFNFADSVRGVPVGLLSVVAKGYHKLEISADEIFYTNIAFRTGVPSFHNILFVGAKPNSFSSDSTYWTFGYGFGTAPRLSKRVSLNFDITAQQIVDNKKIEALNLLNKFTAGVDIRLAKGISFTCAATYNAYVTDTQFDRYQPLFSDYKPGILNDKTFSNGYRARTWIGAKAGFRFF